MPLGLDLEWEATASAAPLGEADGYGQPSVVHGEVLLGPVTLEVDGTGWRSHVWGPTQREDGSWRATAHFDDGTVVYASSGGPAWTYPPGGGAPAAVNSEAVEVSLDGLPASATLTVADVEWSVAPVAWAPVPVDDPPRALRLVRALCSFSGAGRGWGWCEWVSAGG